jgi:S-layer homology domain
MPKMSIRNIAVSIALLSATIVGTKTSSSALPTDPSPKVAQTQVAQARLNDLSSSWAEPFIRALADRNIIVGYPDGTYRPDQPITRAEFAALLNKAFDLPPVRESRAFRDVPPSYWAATVIDKAYRAGFIAGYPNNTFGPSRNILRIESLVAFVNGSRLQPDGTASRVDEVLTDAGQIPSYGRDAIVAATQKCTAVSVSYPTNRTYDPNRIATRADVAATLHQILVAAGRIPALASDSPAQQYIVNCATAAVALSESDILNRTSIGTPPAIVVGSQRKAPNAPAGGITTPTAFGANWGDIFVGAGYQNNLPVTIAPNGSTSTVYGGGIGVGNARQFVGVEASYTSAGASLAERGGYNFKLHKQIGDNLAIAGGWENAIRNGYNATNDPGSTYYGVVTGILPFGETSNLTASVGAGNGRFRTFNDLTLNNSNLNVFGSLGFRFSENIAVAADYNGRNFSVGLPLSVRLGDSVGLQVTPAWLDIAGDQNTGPTSRFGLGGGLGIHF